SRKVTNARRLQMCRSQLPRTTRKSARRRVHLCPSQQVSRKKKNQRARLLRFRSAKRRKNRPAVAVEKWYDLIAFAKSSPALCSRSRPAFFSVAVGLVSRRHG